MQLSRAVIGKLGLPLALAFLLVVTLAAGRISDAPRSVSNRNPGAPSLTVKFSVLPGTIDPNSGTVGLRIWVEIVLNFNSTSNQEIVSIFNCGDSIINTTRVNSTADTSTFQGTIQTTAFLSGSPELFPFDCYETSFLLSDSHLDFTSTPLKLVPQTFPLAGWIALDPSYEITNSYQASFHMPIVRQAWSNLPAIVPTIVALVMAGLTFLIIPRRRTQFVEQIPGITVLLAALGLAIGSIPFQGLAPQWRSFLSVSEVLLYSSIIVVIGFLVWTLISYPFGRASPAMDALSLTMITAVSLLPTMLAISSSLQFRGLTVLAIYCSVELALLLPPVLIPSIIALVMKLRGVRRERRAPDYVR